MTKYEWDRELRRHLSNLSAEEQLKVQEYFDELFEDKLESGMNEYEIIAEFGVPSEAALKIISEFSTDDRTKQTANGNANTGGAVNVNIGYFGGPNDGGYQSFRPGNQQNMRGNDFYGAGFNQPHRPWTDKREKGPDSAEFPKPKDISEGKSKKNGGGKAAWIFFPLTLALIIVFWSLFVSAVAAGIGLTVGGAGCAVYSAYFGFAYGAGWIAYLGAGILTFGLGLIFFGFAKPFFKAALGLCKSFAGTGKGHGEV